MRSETEENKEIFIHVVREKTLQKVITKPHAELSRDGWDVKKYI